MTNELESIARFMVIETGCPIEVAREYLRAFLVCPEAQAAVVAEARRQEHQEREASK